MHTAWATVLLFGTKGNTRASNRGTAILQSRFFICAYMKLLNELTDMKKKMFLMLVVLVSQISLYAKTDCALLGVERKVLFTMNNNENLHLSDFDDDKHLGLMTYFVVDSIFNSDHHEPVYKYSLVVNGERKSNITNTINVCNLYYDDFSKCMYEYVGVDEGVYVKVGNKSYGPYTKVLLKPRKYPFGNGSYHCTSFEHYKQEQFEFWYDDEHFVHEDDGKIRKFSMRRHEYTSPNKKHKVLIADGNPLTTITIDGRNYDLTAAIKNYHNVNYTEACDGEAIGEWYDWYFYLDRFSEYPTLYTTDCCVFDDGTCLYRIDQLDDGNAPDYMYGDFPIYSFYDFYIKGDSIKLLAKHIGITKRDKNGKEIFDENGHCRYDHFYEYYDRQSNSIKRRRTSDEEKFDNMLLVLDKTGKHHLIMDIENKVGFVDEKRIDLDIVLPWSVKFNESKNAFQWVCLEGKDIVFYSYVLNK